MEFTSSATTKALQKAGIQCDQVNMIDVQLVSCTVIFHFMAHGVVTRAT